MTTTPVSWGLTIQVVKTAWRLLSKEKYLPQVLVCNRPKDFLAAALLAGSSTSIKIGSPVCVNSLLSARCKMVLLSIDNDDQLPDLVAKIHETCAGLPFLYQLKTMVMFDCGYPTYNLSVFQLPYQPQFPWETRRDEAGSQDTFSSLDSHPPASSPFPTIQPSNQLKED